MEWGAALGSGKTSVYPGFTFFVHAAEANAGEPRVLGRGCAVGLPVGDD